MEDRELRGLLFPLPSRLLLVLILLLPVLLILIMLLLPFRPAMISSNTDRIRWISLSAKGIRKASHDRQARPPISKPGIADRGPGRAVLLLSLLKFNSRVPPCIHGRLVILGTLLLRRGREGLDYSTTRLLAFASFVRLRLYPWKSESFAAFYFHCHRD